VDSALEGTPETSQPRHQLLQLEVKIAGARCAPCLPAQEAIALDYPVDVFDADGQYEAE